MTKTTWLAYNDLAWTDSLITSPEECKEETEYFVRAIGAIPESKYKHCFTWVVGPA